MPCLSNPTTITSPVARRTIARVKAGMRLCGFHWAGRVMVYWLESMPNDPDRIGVSLKTIKVLVDAGCLIRMQDESTGFLGNELEVYGLPNS